jgi:hypothetical protein
MRAFHTNWLIGLFLTIAILPAKAEQSGSPVVRIEEDWELIVDTPDPLQDAPQVSTWMSPTGSLDNKCFGLDLNHAQRAGYEGGGFQTKAMNGSNVVEDRLCFIGDNLDVTGETITWTQVMAIVDNDLVFWIKNGTSQSWGDFGGYDTLVRHSSNLNSLGSYDHDVSCESSGVGYASNRVASLKLVRIRYFRDNGQINVVTLNHTIQ